MYLRVSVNMRGAWTGSSVAGLRNEHEDAQFLRKTAWEVRGLLACLAILVVLAVLIAFKTLNSVNGDGRIALAMLHALKTVVPVGGLMWLVGDFAREARARKRILEDRIAYRSDLQRYPTGAPVGRLEAYRRFLSTSYTRQTDTSTKAKQRSPRPNVARKNRNDARRAN
jgi:hypothetical protein